MLRLARENVRAMERADSQQREATQASLETARLKTELGKEQAGHEETRAQLAALEGVLVQLAEIYQIDD